MSVNASNLNLEERKNKAEKEILLKEIPGIEDHIPDDVDLNVGINAPLKKTDGSDYNGNSCALIQTINTWLIPDLVELLLKHGANPNTTVETNYAQNITALMLAAKTSMPARTIEALLAYGADYRLKDSNGYTAIDWAGHYITPGMPLDPGMNQCFALHELDPEQNPQESTIPLLAEIYSSISGKELQNIFDFCGQNIPHNICSVVDQYRFDFSEISLALSQAHKSEQIRFLGMLKQAHKIYTRNKKLDKLASLSDAEIDHLLAAHRRIAAPVQQNLMIDEVSLNATAPLIFSERRGVKNVSGSATSSADVAQSADVNAKVNIR